MRYSTPTLLIKYLHYYWVAANTKGHGIHSPFVFKFIKEILNAKSSLEQVENSAPSIKKILQEIEAAGSSKLTPKFKLLIACIKGCAARSDGLNWFKRTEVKSAGTWCVLTNADSSNPGRPAKDAMNFSGNNQ